MTTTLPVDYTFNYYPNSGGTSNWAADSAALEYTYHFPMMPGLWIFQPTDGAYPVFESIGDLGPGSYYMEDINDGHILMPGFKTVMYADPAYSGTVIIDHDNRNYNTSNGWKHGSINNISSIRLTFRNTEINTDPRNNAQASLAAWRMPRDHPYLTLNPFGVLNTIDREGVVDYLPYPNNSNSANIGSGLTISGSGTSSDGTWLYIPSDTATVKLSNITFNRSTDTAGFTFACFYKLTSVTGGNPSGIWHRIFDFGTSYGSGTAFGLGFNDNSDPYTLWFFYNGGQYAGLGTNTAVATNVALSMNQSYHICFTFNAQGASVNVYVNGRMVKTTVDANMYPANATYTSCLLGKSNFSNDANGRAYFAQVLRFNRCLNQSEIYYLAVSDPSWIRNISSQNLSSSNPISSAGTRSNFFPTFPGAWVVNGVYWAMPIFTSYYNVASNTSIGDRDDAYIVMPGFKVVIYADGGYGAATFTIDNTRGFKAMYTKPYTANSMDAIKLYYGVTEVTSGGNPFSTTSANTTTANNSIPTNIPYQYEVGPGVTSWSLQMNEFIPMTGVYIVNSNYGLMPATQSFRDLTMISYNDVNDGFIVMPGFGVEVYENFNYGNGRWNFTNADGYNIMVPVVAGHNACSSVYVSFRNVRMLDNQNTASGGGYWS